MKKVIFTFLMFLLSFSLVKSQGLEPVLVVWQVDQNRVSLRKALYGIDVSNSLKLNVYFNKNQLKNKDLKFEFRWYYYLSTRRKLVQTQLLSLKDAKETAQGLYLLSSELTTVQPGWWEVQVVVYPQRQFISFANRNKFQIYVRRKLYASLR